MEGKRAHICGNVAITPRMIPVLSVAGLEPGSVLYHSALGFASVVRCEADDVVLRWERAGRHHPSRVSLDSLQRGYQKCVEGGFFARSVHSPAALLHLIDADPAAALCLLLAELPGALRRADVRDWILGRGLLEAGEFERWWQRARSSAKRDSRLAVESRWISLSVPRDAALPEPPADLFARGLELEEACDERVALFVQAFVGGTPALRRKILAALARRGASRFLERLVELGDMNGVALVVDHLDLEPSEVPDALIDRVHDLQETFGDGSEASVRLARAEGRELTLSALLPLSFERWSEIALESAGQLAHAHARGERLRPSIDRAFLMPGGGIRLEDDDEAQVGGTLPPSQQDVVVTARFLLELALGALPDSDRFPPTHLLTYLYALPGTRLPPAVVGALAAGLRPLEPAVNAHVVNGLHIDGADAHPTTALAFWHALSTALSIESGRAHSLLVKDTRWEVGCDTHIGRRKMLVGQTNQDALFRDVGEEASFFLVCDGISIATVGRGDIASAVAVQTMANRWMSQRESMASRPAAGVGEALEESARLANHAIGEISLELAEGNLAGEMPMGTTIATAVVVGNRADVLTLGDSRVYLVGPWGTSILSVDQNLDLQRVQAHLSGESVDWSRPGHGLIGYCGYLDESCLPELLPLHRQQFHLLPGESLVICSDGISDYIAHGEATVAAIVGTVVRSLSPQDAASRLVDMANRGGGGDNATVIVARQMREDLE